MVEGSSRAPVTGWAARPALDGPQVTNHRDPFACSSRAEAGRLRPMASQPEAAAAHAPSAPLGDPSPDASALAAVDEAARAIAGVLGIEDVLQLIVDRVR